MSKLLGIDFPKHFRAGTGFADRFGSRRPGPAHSDGLKSPSAGRLFIRNIAMRFDAYLPHEPNGAFPRRYEIGCHDWRRELRGSPPPFDCSAKGHCRHPLRGRQPRRRSHSVRPAEMDTSRNSVRTPFSKHAPKIPALVRDYWPENRRLYSDPRAENRYLVRDRKSDALAGLAARFFCALRSFSPVRNCVSSPEPFIHAAPSGARRKRWPILYCAGLAGNFSITPLTRSSRGVYAGDPHRLSVKHAFPKLHALEQRYGSLIRGPIPRRA